MRFKRGDRVKCINNNIFEDRLTVGKIYDIVDTAKSFYCEDLIMIGIDDKGVAGPQYKSSRFELYVEEVNAVFKVGDKVWSVGNGWGEVVEITDDSYPVRVKYAAHNITYTSDGKYTEKDINRSLFFEEITIPKSALIKPKWRADKNCMYYCVSSDGMVVHVIEYNRAIDDRRHDHGNYFETIQLARESEFYKVFHK